MRQGPLVVVGDALLDRDVTGRAERLSPDAPVPVVSAVSEAERPGGAALSALLAALDTAAGTGGRAGRQVVLVTALGADAAGERVADLLSAAGVTVVAGRLAGRTPQKERVRVAGQSLLRLDREDGRPGPVEVSDPMRDAVRQAGAVLVSDYGRGVAGTAAVRGWLADATRTVPVVWDPHPRSGPPVPGVRLVTPNLAEALGFAGCGPQRGAVPSGSPVAVAARAGRTLAQRWRAGGVAVTLGAAGALLATADDVPLVVPAPRVGGGDPCGAGDRFAAAVATRLADGALPSEAVTAGVAAASAYVAAGGPAALPPAPSTPDTAAASGVDEVVRRTRAAGGTVVATGGCFDLLHAGHVATLEAARRLGDCLVVCVNSDRSARRLKGPPRPLVPARDRVRVLAALGSVDAVTVFDEDTPLAVLDRIRPDVWVKGGDYTALELPETRLLAGWGGEV
ncbi:MAG TPA: PfkB family carbohydrate kinase, partial [Mycobacteriales bacterium]|nr:PfkB family carbohydrate kinase [Mycobacteriales bacterium]